MDADNEDILIKDFVALVEENARYALEGDGDLRASLGHALGGADEEGDAGPAPVVDVHLEGDISLRGGILGDSIGLAVTRHRLAVDEASGVLGADDMMEDIITTERSEGTQDLHLLVTDGIGTQAGRRLHCGQGEELQKMILDHVSHGP